MTSGNGPRMENGIFQNKYKFWAEFITEKTVRKVLQKSNEKKGEEGLRNKQITS